ncbi:MAG: type II CAAX endopeptidase family protein [Bacillota bacterium]|nr:type II CAAX endopeptidase family protein [Bacillota bacterium]
MKLKRTTLAGISLALVFLFFNGAYRLLGSVSQNEYSLIIFIELLSFLIPTALLILVPDGEPVKLRLKPFNRKSLGFVIKSSFAISFLSVLLNFFVSFAIGSFPGAGVTSEMPAASGGVLFAVISVALVPALSEELYMRGAFFSSYEHLGTGTAILMSALSFALIHVSAYNFFGPFAAGLLYAYLTYTLDSIWPAVIAHGLNNLYSLIMNSLMQKYTAFGLWPYFMVLNLFCLLIFAYIALNSLEKLTRKGTVKKFQKGSRNTPASLFETILSPGFLLFMLLFISRIFLKLFAS